MAIAETTFDFSTDSHPVGDFRISVLEAEEYVSRPFWMDVTAVVQKDATVDETKLVGEGATLTIRPPEKDERYLHGIIAGVRSWEAGSGKENHRHLQFRVVPSLWRLGQTRNSRIFQKKSIPNIVKEVLDAWKVTHVWGNKRSSGPDGLASTYPQRDYVVQYGETDLEFVSRLLETVGIFYFFEFEDGKHTLVLVDGNASCHDIPGDIKIPFRSDPSALAQDEFLDDFSCRLEVRSGTVTLRDFDYLKPTVDLTAPAKGQVDANLEVYEYPGGYDDAGAGKSLAKLRLEERRARAELFAGKGRVARFAAGAEFELEDHPLNALNAKYLLLSVRHVGTQAHSAPEQGGSQAAESYRCHLEAIEAKVPFRPARWTPRPIMPGPQTAVVVGPKGEEIYTDAHGRIKVQFHWDRAGKNDESSSCWMRVTQPWAGPSWGALYLPRIGQEVVVEFLEGDPDRPIVTGAVYNGLNPPPYDLPGEKTKSTLKSDSSPGGGGSNELRFEDAKGSEEVFLHAQKDMHIVVENDKDQKVHGNETLAVDKDRSITVGGNQQLSVSKNDSTTIGANQTLAVTGSRATTVAANHSESIGGSQTVEIAGAQTLTVALASAETVGLAKALTVGGAYAITVGAAMNELVGGMKSEEVAGAKVEVVGAKRTEQVAGTRSVEVGGDLSEAIAGKRTLKVGKDLTVSVTGKMQQSVTDACVLKAKQITLNADDEAILKVGSATISMKKSGDIVIKGGNIDVKASGNLTLKGSKIGQN
jgi:type VI secretion system secreted protein VgrG